MRFQSVDAIREHGFFGFVRISSLQTTNCANVPNAFGVYLVVRTDNAEPQFLEESVGGHFKGKNPTVPVSHLQSMWVEDAIVIYIGKAGPTPDRTLKQRVSEYMRFGKGHRAAHTGGRFIWQMCHSGNLLVCWKPTHPEVNPRDEEKKLIREFEMVYGRIPFANNQH